MAARGRIVKVRVEPVLFEHGLWCRRCLLSSGVGMWVAMRTEQRMHLQRRAWCTDCGGTDVDHP